MSAHLPLFQFIGRVAGRDFRTTIDQPGGAPALLRISIVGVQPEGGSFPVYMCGSTVVITDAIESSCAVLAERIEHLLPAPMDGECVSELACAIRRWLIENR